MFRDGVLIQCLVFARDVASALLLVVTLTAQSRGVELSKVDINQPGDSLPSQLAAVANRVVAAAFKGTDREIHIVDPLTVDPLNPSNNISIVVNVDPATSSHPLGITEVGDLAFFSAMMSLANRELYIVDPLLPGAGATLIEINPAGASTPESITEVEALAGDLAVMAATTAVGGRELFVVDPMNLAGGAIEVDINPGAGSSNPTQIVSIAERAVFVATNDGVDVELYVVDPHMPGLGATEVEINAGGSSNPTEIVGAANLAVFSAFDGTDRELFIVDPTMPGLGATKVDIFPGAANSNPLFLAVVGDLVVFRATAPVTGTEVHILDPTMPGAGTTVIDVNSAPFQSSLPTNFTAVAGRAVFTANDGTDTELHVLDPLNPAAGTTKIDINPAGSTVVQELTAVAGRAVFRASLDGDTELYVVDPLFPEYGFVKIDVNPAGSSSPTGFVDVAGRLAFSATVGGDTELYILSFDNTWNSSLSGAWETDANWRSGVAPRMIDDVVISPANGLTVTAPAGETAVGSITIGATSGTATLALSGGTIRTHHATINPGGRLAGSGTLLTDVDRVVNHGTIDLAQGLQLTGGPLENHGNLFAGSGIIGATLDNEAIGQVRALDGQQAVFTGMGNTNLGEINLLGGLVEFTHDLLNERIGLDNGLISGRGTLFVHGGLTNDGAMAFSGGLTDVFGDVENRAPGQIVNSGSSTLTFFDDVVNNGDIRTTVGSTTVIFGGYSGAGTTSGGGTMSLEGDLSPGNSAGLLSFGTNVELRPSSALLIELGGTARGGQYDAIDATGSVALDGTLEVTLIDVGAGVFAPQAGQSFSLISAEGGISGNFDGAVMPDLGTLLQWQLERTVSELLLHVTIAGDFNRDGVVGAADFVAWRNAQGQSGLLMAADADGDGTVGDADYDLWRQNFGSRLGDLASAAGATIPEPTTGVLILMAGFLLLGRPGAARQLSRL